VAWPTISSSSSSSSGGLTASAHHHDAFLRRPNIAYASKPMAYLGQGLCASPFDSEKEITKKGAGKSS